MAKQSVRKLSVADLLAPGVMGITETSQVDLRPLGVQAILSVRRLRCAHFWRSFEEWFIPRSGVGSGKYADVTQVPERRVAHLLPLLVAEATVPESGEEIPRETIVSLLTEEQVREGQLLLACGGEVRPLTPEGVPSSVRGRRLHHAVQAVVWGEAWRLEIERNLLEAQAAADPDEARADAEDDEGNGSGAG